MNKISPYHIAKSPVLDSNRLSYRDLAKKESDLRLRTETGNIRLIPAANSFHRSNKNVIIDSHITNSSWEPYVRKRAKIGRNDMCYCGSGLKFKYCCINK